MLSWQGPSTKCLNKIMVKNLCQQRSSCSLDHEPEDRGELEFLLKWWCLKGQPVIKKKKKNQCYKSTSSISRERKPFTSVWLRIFYLLLLKQSHQNSKYLPSWTDSFMGLEIIIWYVNCPSIFQFLHAWKEKFCIEGIWKANTMPNLSEIHEINKLY